MSALGVTDAHESWQPAGSEEQWSDSFYFGGGDGRGLAFYSQRVAIQGARPILEAVLGTKKS